MIMWIVRKESGRKSPALLIYGNMAKEFSKRLYKSAAWQACRTAYIKKVGGLCERCFKEGKIVPGVIVHHKIYLTPENVNEPRITLNFDNLELLCEACHNKEHFKERVESRYKVNADGTIAPR